MWDVPPGGIECHSNSQQILTQYVPPGMQSLDLLLKK